MTDRKRNPKKPKTGKGHAAVAQLRNIAAIRPELSSLETLEELTTRGAQMARSHVKAQIASVFLYNQCGRVERVALVGQDREGRAIDNYSLPDEQHLPGEGFTGKAVVGTEESPFGQAQWSNALGTRKDISRENRNIYSRLLGKLRAAVSVPLNGKHRSFGALEVINKQDPKLPSNQQSFDKEDVHWLSLIGNELALVLSERRRAERARILEHLAEAAVSMFDSTTNEQRVYDEVVQSLTEPPLPYRVCIIRLRHDGQLSTRAAGSAQVSLEGREEGPLPRDHGWAGRAFRKKELVYVKDIGESDPEEEHLINWEWARERGLRSYICIPLLAQGQNEGTLSIYFGYKYSLDPDEHSFLTSLARFLSSFATGRRVLNDIQEISQLDAFDRRMVATLPLRKSLHKLHHEVYDFLHNELPERLNELRGRNLATDSAAREFKDLREKVKEITERVEMELQGPEAEAEYLDVNEIIASIAAERRRLPMKAYTDFVLRLDRKVPAFIAESSDLRYTIRELVVNAVKSIQRKDQGYGKVIVETAAIEEDDGTVVEILVEDTGEGIPHEEWENIFTKGYSGAGGTGQGLALARTAVKELEGTIEVLSSTVGEGTKFRVRLHIP